MNRVKSLPKRILPYFLALFLAHVILRIFQILEEPNEIFRTKIQTAYHVKGFLMDLLLALLVAAAGSILTLLFSFLLKRIHLVFLHVLAVVSILSNYALTVYFVKTNQLLGDVFYQLSYSELMTSANLDSNLTFFSISFPILLILLYFLVGSRLRKLRISKTISITFGSLMGISLFVYPWKVINSRDYVGDMVINNKLIAFVGVSEKHFFGGDELDQVSISVFRQLDDSFFPDPATRNNEYSLIHELGSESEFGTYLNKSPKGPPNIVIIIVESLSSFLVGNNENNPGHFMPFLDSLSQKSLYFPNFMSTCERTHNVLPATLCSAPNPPERQFMQSEEYPRHWSLFSLMDRYYSRFYCGVDLEFSDMDNFMEYNQVDYVPHSWGSQFPRERNGVYSSWGYADDQLFEKSFSDDKKYRVKRPKLDVFLTISTHEPFTYPNKQQYLKRVHEKVKRSKKCTRQQRKEMTRLAEIYGSYLFTDEALQNYFQKASKKADYDNTIFFILGDHGNPLFPRNEIQKYQTPLFIFSPLLKKTGRFNSLSSHNDLAPTILNYLRINYPELNLPKQVPFVGQEISFEKRFTCKRTLPLITLDSETKHLIYGDHYQYEGQLYRIQKGMNLTPSNNEELNNKLTKQLFAYHKLAQYYHENDKILPKEQFRKFARKGNKIVLRNDFVKTIVNNESSDEYIQLAPKVRIKKGWKGLEITLTGEIFLNDRKDLEEFVPLVYSLERINKKKQVRYEDFYPKLQEPLQMKKWNKITYSFFIDVRKYSSKDQNYELAYYLLNSKSKKVKLRKSMIEVLAWK
jgi:lipoteichoic acid synthase